LYLRQLAEHAGHRIALTRINAGEWIDASRRSHLADYDAMTTVIRGALSD
jgi:cell filamentation protein